MPVDHPNSQNCWHYLHPEQWPHRVYTLCVVDHDGKGLSIGLVVTDQRLWILDLAAGLVAASVAGVHLESELSAIAEVETERMQGSGLKRLGAVIRLVDGSVERVIPAKAPPFLTALGV